VVVPGITAKNSEETPTVANFAPSLPPRERLTPAPRVRAQHRVLGLCKEERAEIPGGGLGSPRSGGAAASSRAGSPPPAPFTPGELPR